MKATTIKIHISGREYPVSVTADTEALMNKAAVMVNEQVQKYSSSYAISDPRDLLAMCALQLAFQNLEKDQAGQLNLDKIENKVKTIEATLDIS